MICEGPTEQAFAKTNLQVPFIYRDIYLQTPLIKASKGGIVKWNKLKDQIDTPPQGRAGCLCYHLY